MPSKQNILISACLLGNPVRYNGTDLLIDHPLLKKWQQQKRLIPICPEVAGGLATPRAPAEITNNTNEQVVVMNINEQDVSSEFILGANKALALAQEHACVAAILTERSPSCGSTQIYDGSFSGIKKNGMGVTATLLSKNNIRVFNQHQLEQVKAFLENL